jgi:hypothetical protein
MKTRINVGHRKCDGWLGADCLKPIRKRTLRMVLPSKRCFGFAEFPSWRFVGTRSAGRVEGRGRTSRNMTELSAQRRSCRRFLSSHSLLRFRAGAGLTSNGAHSTELRARGAFAVKSSRDDSWHIFLKEEERIRGHYDFPPAEISSAFPSAVQLVSPLEDSD